MADNSPMTDEQQALVEKWHDLIYWYLHRHRLPIDEYYDVAAFGLIRAAKTYTENERTRRYAFSTIANQCMRCETTGLEIRRRNTQKRRAVVLSLNLPIGDDLCLGDTIHAHIDTAGEAIMQAQLRTVISGMDDRDKQILALCHAGYIQREIAKQLGLSQAEISRKLKQIKTKLIG